MSKATHTKDRPFTPLNIAVLTVSDRHTPDTDTSGTLLSERIAAAGHILAERALLPHDQVALTAQVLRWIEDGTTQVIITNGGTGLHEHNVTPEALEPLFAKRIDGFSALFHALSFQSIGTSTLSSRASAGITPEKVLIFCLPGSENACADGWDKVIREQLDARHKPCNLVGLLRH